MKLRRYVISTWRKKDNSISKFTVTDAENDDELDTRPDIAEFPVCEKYPADIQHHHAKILADYLNKIQEATEQAYEENMIIDILKK